MDVYFATSRPFLTDAGWDPTISSILSGGAIESMVSSLDRTKQNEKARQSLGGSINEIDLNIDSVQMSDFLILLIQDDTYTRAHTARLS